MLLVEHRGGGRCATGYSAYSQTGSCGLYSLQLSKLPVDILDTSQCWAKTSRNAWDRMILAFCCSNNKTFANCNLLLPPSAYEANTFKEHLLCVWGDMAPLPPPPPPMRGYHIDLFVAIQSCACVSDLSTNFYIPIRGHLHKSIKYNDACRVTRIYWFSYRYRRNNDINFHTVIKELQSITLLCYIVVSNYSEH